MLKIKLQENVYSEINHQDNKIKNIYRRVLAEKAVSNSN